MENPPTLHGLKVGPMRLDKTHDGRLVAHHPKLAQPVNIDEKQLERWLMRQIRDEVSA
jgi:hypothetical protein